MAPTGTLSSTHTVSVTAVTTCANVALFEALLPASPPYAALMLCVPVLKALVVQGAVLLLLPPASATALQPLIELPPSVKLTLPVGLLPATVAVNVTLAPTADGFSELASVVVVGAGPDA